MVGARGSRLSMTQTEWVIGQLKDANAGSEYETKPITTKGDTDMRPLFTIDQKGIFSKEVDRAVMNNSIDFAVHSMKDVPSEMPDGLCLACVPKREQVNDILISQDGLRLDDLSEGMVVGTSSLRRAVQITRQKPDVSVRPIRGNIETRIKKIDSPDYDAVILASAGIRRLGINPRHTILSTDDFSPSPCQGALAIISRIDDHDTISMLKKIEDPDSRAAVEAERSLSRTVDSGCRFPLGAYARSYNDTLTLEASAFSIDGSKNITAKQTCEKSSPTILGRSVGQELRQKGISNLARGWREKVEEWNRA